MISKEQSLIIASRILRNKFGVYGYGNFDIGIEDLSELLFLAINKDEQTVDDSILNFYNSIKWMEQGSNRPSVENMDKLEEV